MAHVLGGDFAGEFGERGAKLGEFFESVVADDGDSVVGRKIMAIIVERNEVKSVDEPVSGIAGDNVHLMINESAIEEAKVHDVGRRGEVEMVAVAPATETVGALEKFVADADAPFRSHGGKVRHAAEVELAGVSLADDHSEGVGEAQRFGDVEVEALCVLLLYATVDCGGVVIGRRGFVEDRGESGAGVFDVEIEVAGEEGLLDEEGAAEIGLADDENASASFNVLCEKLGEDHLFGEEFGADSEMRSRRFATGDGKESEVKEIKQVKDS